jgi:hypothetical protein
MSIAVAPADGDAIAGTERVGEEIPLGHRSDEVLSPEDAASWPAIMRSVEVLPQPDGPRRQQ